MVVEHLLCDRKESNDIHKVDQNKSNKDDEFFTKIFKEISKMKEWYTINERYT